MPAFPGVDIAAPNTDTPLFTNTSGGDLTINVNLCNRNGLTANIRLHVVPQGGSASAANAIEWDRPVRGGGVLERWAITLGPNQFLVGRSSLASVNAVCWGA
jgi:hypothetical protein